MQTSSFTERTLPKSDYAVMELDHMSRSHSETFKNHFEDGFYCCAHCAGRLFSSTEKISVLSRYPAFRRSIARSFVRIREDCSYGTLNRVIHCSQCGLYLGLMLETKGLDGKPVKCFAILSIAIQFEPRANAGNAPNHIEEEEEESEGEAEGSPATPPPAIQQMQIQEELSAASSAKSAKPADKELKNSLTPTQPAVSQWPSKTPTPTPHESFGAKMIKYAHIALVAGPVLVGLYHKYSSHGSGL